MPRNMSVSLTEDAVRARTKTVTRRNGWQFLTPGTRLMLCRKVMGRKPDEPLVRIVEVEVESVRRERLDAITADDVAAEGFPDWTPGEFVEFFCRTHKGCTPDTEVTRIQWRYLLSEAEVAEAEQILESLTVQRRRPTPWCRYSARPSVSLAGWVREWRGDLLSHVEGAQAAVDWAPQLPMDLPGEPAAVCTDRWLASLPHRTPDAPAPYAVSRTGKRRLVHVTTTEGEWTYLVVPGHPIDPAFLWDADLCGWTLQRLTHHTHGIGGGRS